MRQGDWKGVRLAPNLPLELFNLSRDLGEERDVAAENPEIVAKFEAILVSARTEHPIWPLKSPRNP